MKIYVTVVYWSREEENTGSCVVYAGTDIDSAHERGKDAIGPGVLWNDNTNPVYYVEEWENGNQVG